MTCNRDRSSWTRRSVLQAGAGLAAYGLMAREVCAETSVAAEAPCVDMPLLTATDFLGQAAAQKSPTQAALLHNAGKQTVQQSMPAQAAASLTQLFAPGSGLPDTGPSRAAFSRRWTGISRLNVFFMGGATALHTTVMRRLEDWSRVIQMDFKQVTRASDSQIRVNFDPNNGHWSFVGNDADGQLGQRTMNLAMTTSTIGSAYNQGVILHEFGHSLGMIHEHQNPNSTLVFKTPEELRPFFAGTGLETAESIRLNVTERYKVSQLIKFSEFDPLSIMLYAFPQGMLRSGTATRQNTVLSELDIKFARLMYGSRGDTTTTTTPERQTFDLKLNADPLEAKLAAGGNVEFNLTLGSSDGDKEISIYTSGTTRVMLVLKDSSGNTITPKGTGRHGTPDLTNEVINARLAAGTYKVIVTHPSARGGGHFKMRATTEANKQYLAAPNEKQ